MNEFKELIQASMRPMAVFIMLFILGWLLTTGQEIPTWYIAMIVSILSFLFGERKVTK